MRKILFLHRWLGIVACVAVLVFAGSGILHPVMSALQPRAAQMQPPAIEWPQRVLSLRNVLQQNSIDEISGATVAQLANIAAYRVQTREGVRYFRVDSGAPIENGEVLHAESLARYFLADTNGVITHAARIDAFDDDYVFINRILPAWRIDFARDDAMRVYVDTAGNRLVTLSDRPKRIFQIYFRTLHNFEFLHERNGVRIAVMLVLLAATFATAVFGVVMYVRLKRAALRLRDLPARRWHRRLSLAVAIVMFSFTTSGAWHLLQSQSEVEAVAAPVNTFRTDELGDAVIQRAFTLARTQQGICYWAANAMPAKANGDEHAHHPMHVANSSSASAQMNLSECFDTRSGEPIANADRRLAEQLARHYSHSEADIVVLEPVTKFSGEYGFVNKRLPVWRAQFADAPTRWYVETRSGALAARVDPAAALEGEVFSLLHKARFIGDAYKNWRDAFLMIAALGCIVVALLGLFLFFARRRPAQE